MPKPVKQAEGGSDGGWGWMVVLGGFAIHFTFLGLLRSAGVLYVALVDSFDISREEASWPFTLSAGLMFVIAPLAAFLTNYLSIRQIVLCGVTIGALSVSGCFFANDIMTIIVLYGGLQGFGIGLMYTLNPVIVNQYFTRKKATALGVMYAGASVGSFTIPLVTELLLEKYGLRGCLLILGGVMLNAVVGACLYRPPKINLLRRYTALSPQKVQKRRDNILPLIEEAKKTEIAFQKPIGNNEIMKNDKEKHNESKEEDTLINKMPIVIIKAERKFSSQSLATSEILRKMSVDVKHGVTNSAKVISEILLHPLFVIICLTMTGFFACTFTYLIVIVDHATDRGITTAESVYFVSIYSLADLFGRLTMGWFSDLPSVPRRHIVLTSTLIIGVLMECFAFGWNYVIMSVSSALLGLFSGCLLINYPPLMEEILGIDKLASAMGFIGVMIGCIGLTRPFLIGYFRDTFGTYDNLFHTFAGFQFFCCLLWILEPIVRWDLKRRRKKNATESVENGKIPEIKA